MALTRERWTEGELSLLRRMWDEGYTEQEIADALGRTRGSVRMKRARLGLEDENRHLEGGRYMHRMRAEFSARARGEQAGGDNHDMQQMRQANG